MLKKTTKLDEIQKLRAMALLMCCMGHFPFALPDILIHGYTGVTIFFVISGYVCAMSYTNSFTWYRENTEKLHYRKTAAEFWISRFFRVIPVTSVWLLIYFFTGQHINNMGGSYGDVSRWMTEFKWWFSGVYNYFVAYSNLSGLFGHFWMIAVEIQFYLLLPVFFSVFRTKKARSYACIIIIFLSSTLFRIWTPPEAIGLVTHTQLDSLFLGVLIFLWREDWKPAFLHRVPQNIRILSSVVLLLAIYLLPAWLDRAAPPIVKYPIFTVLAGVLLYLAQMDEGWIFGKGAKVTGFFNKIANVSFSVYILHVLVFSGIYYFYYSTYLLPNSPELLEPFWVVMQVVILSLICYGLGYLSVKLIENPYAEYGKKMTGKFRQRST